MIIIVFPPDKSGIGNLLLLLLDSHFRGNDSLKTMRIKKTRSRFISHSSRLSEHATVAQTLLSEYFQPLRRFFTIRQAREFQHRLLHKLMHRSQGLSERATKKPLSLH